VNAAVDAHLAHFAAATWLRMCRRSRSCKLSDVECAIRARRKPLSFLGDKLTLY